MAQDKKRKLTELYIKTSKPEEVLLDTIEKLQEFDSEVKYVKSKFDETYNYITENKPKSDEELEEMIKPLIKPLIPKVKDGKIPTSDELSLLIKPLIPAPINGSPDTAEEVRDKIASLKDDERLSVLALKDTEWLKNAKDTFIQGNIVGGILKVNHDSSLTGAGTNDSPLKVATAPASKFTDLTDVPHTYTGQAGKAVYVNGTETGLIFSTAVSTDEKVKTSATDTTAGYLNDKLVAGSNITITKNNAGGNETLTIASTGGGTPGGADTNVQYNSTGTFAGASAFSWDNINKILNLGGGTPTWSISVGNSLTAVKTYAGSHAWNIQNKSNGNTSTTDIFLNSDAASDTTNYFNLGINSSTYSDPTYASDGVLDAYAYAYGGNLVIGASSTGKATKFVNDSNLANALQGTVDVNGFHSYIAYDIYPVQTPAALSGVVSAGGSVDTGIHNYSVTFTTALGETTPWRITSTTTAGNNTVTLTIPVSTDPRVTGRNIYRTKAGDANYNDYYLATVADNTTVTYVDTAADSTLTVGPGASSFRLNTTNKEITYNGSNVFRAQANGTIIGYSAGSAITFGGRLSLFGNSAGGSITTGTDNSCFGASSGGGITTGTSNACFAANTGSYLGNGTGNSLFGHNAGYYLKNSSGSAFFGKQAGFGVNNKGGDYNSGFGQDSLGSIGNGSNNAGFGRSAGYGLGDGSLNTAIGAFSGPQTSTAASNTISLGSYSGKYGTSTGYLYIDTYDRTNDANSRIYGLITGFMSSTNTSQWLQLGGGGNVGIGLINASQKLDVVGKAILFGADNGVWTSRTDATPKVGNFFVPHYTNAQPPFVAYYGYSGFSDNAVNFGGGNSNYNSATYIRFFTATTNTTLGGGTERMRIIYNGNVGIGIDAPTAVIHLKAGTATASTAPLKFTAGTNLTNAEAGAMEWDGTNLFVTQTTGPTRKTIAYTTDITVSATSTITFTNKRNQPRTYSIASNTSLTPEIDTYDLFIETALAGAITINNHSTSTPVDGEKMVFRIKDNGSARAISFGTYYRAMTYALPTTTTINKTMYMVFVWNGTDTKWDLMSITQEP